MSTTNKPTRNVTAEDLGLDRGKGTGKHTPGPWSVRASCPYMVETKAQGVTALGHGIRIANCQTELNAQQEANARLIAAAPELLERLWMTNQNIALMHSEQEHGHDVSVCDCGLAVQWRNNEAVIAKAEGKG